MVESIRDWFRRALRSVRGRLRTPSAKFIARRKFCLTCVSIIVLASLVLIPVAGQDFFPIIDAGMMKLHIRAATGTRIEETERIVDNIERAIRKIIPPEELGDISDNIGVPTSYDLAYYQTDSVAGQDADVLIQLKPSIAQPQCTEDRFGKCCRSTFRRSKATFKPPTSSARC